MADPHPTTDEQIEHATLTFLLHEHPDRLIIPEVSRAMNRFSDFNSQDAVERAIRELVGAGLLHCQDGYVQPTRAALYYERLERFG